MNLKKKILNKLHPLLKPFSQWYLSSTRTYRYENIVVKIYPGIFHPGLFISTKILLEFVKTQPLDALRVLELGAGSGLISICCAKAGARVTSSDISLKALACVRENAKMNGVEIQVVHSDLFDHVNPHDFDLIIINPPYYAKAVQSEKDYAWYCGENFQYFKKLFYQLRERYKEDVNIVMILSEDCDLKKISSLATQERLILKVIDKRKSAGEENYIFKITA